MLVNSAQVLVRAAASGQLLGAEDRLAQAQAKAQGLPPDPQALAGMLTLFERLRPLAIGSVSAAFPVVLQQEFDRTLQKHIKSKHTKGTRSRS